MPNLEVFALSQAREQVITCILILCEIVPDDSSDNSYFLISSSNEERSKQPAHGNAGFNQGLFSYILVLTYYEVPHGNFMGAYLENDQGKGEMLKNVQMVHIATAKPAMSIALCMVSKFN